MRLLRTAKETWLGFTGGKKAIDGCDVDFTEDVVDDEDIDGIVMFADVDPADYGAVLNRASELQELSVPSGDLKQELTGKGSNA